MLIIAFIIIILLFFCATVKIVPQGREYVIERLGKYSRTLGPGLNIVVPFFDAIRKKVDVREIVMDYPPQPVITKDNVTIQIDAVVYYHVVDSKQYTYGAVSTEDALRTLTETTLRNIIGGLELDETLTSRDHINAQMQIAIDEAAKSWGIAAERVDLKEIRVSQDLQDALERELRAERERRALVTESEGKKQSQILQAEGEKEAMVLRAQAEKEVAVQQAQGRAEAIRLMYKAQADGIAEINKANPSHEYVQLEGFKYLKDLANGQATKIIVPSNLQSLAGTVASVSEIVKDDPLNVTEEVKMPEPDPYEKLRTEHNPETHVFKE